MVPLLSICIPIVCAVEGKGRRRREGGGGRRMEEGPRTLSRKRGKQETHKNELVFSQEKEAQLKTTLDSQRFSIDSKGGGAMS